MNIYSEYWREHWLSNSKLEEDNPQKQVARTKFGKPISNNDWSRTCEHIVRQLRPQSTNTLLDLCCGNGLLTTHLCDYVSKIIAVDYSNNLLDSFVVENSKIFKVHSDVLDFNYDSYKFDRVVMYYAAQHFSESTLLTVIKKIYGSMSPGAVLLIGDIPDSHRKWDYFYKKEFRDFYYSGLESGQPSVGTWYDKGFFEYLPDYIGFKSVIIQDQPEFMNNSNHRFDVILIR